MNWKRRSFFWSRINYLWFIGFLIDINFPTLKIVALPLLYNYESVSITKVSSTFYSIILPHNYKNTFIYFKNVADWRFRLTLKTYLKCPILEFSKFPIHFQWISIVKFVRPVGGQMTFNHAQFFFWAFHDICTQNKKRQQDSQKSWKYETP